MSSLNFTELCRLCLVKERVSIPIFEGEGDVRQILLKIAACLPVKIAKEDKLPKKICDECMYKLDNAYQFWNAAANAEKQLMQWLGDAANEDRKNVPSNPSNTIETEQLVLKEEAIEQETPDVSKNLSRIEEVLDDERGGSDDEDTESEEEGSNSEDTGDDEPPGKEEAESEEEPFEALEPTTFVNVSLAGCDEAGPSGIQQPAQVAATEPSQQQQQQPQPQGAPSTSSAEAAAAATTAATAPPPPAAAATSAPSGLAGVQSVGFSLNTTSFVTGANPQLVYILPPLVVNSNMLNTAPRPRNILPSNEQIRSSVVLTSSSGNEGNIALGNTSPLLNINPSSAEVGCTQLLNSSLGNTSLHSTLITPNRHILPNTKQIDSFFVLKGSSGSEKIVLGNGSSVLPNSLITSNMPLLLNSYPVAGNPTLLNDLTMTFNSFPNSVHATNHCNQSNLQVPILQPKDIKVESDVKIQVKSIDIHNQSLGDSITLSTAQSLSMIPTSPDFSCKTCGKNFISRTKLTKHKRSHDEKRPFECSACNRKFRERNQLNKHELNHKNVKRYKCYECGFTSFYKYALEFHQKRHSKSFCFFCDICNKGFFDKGSLKRHLDYHAGRIFQCETCGVVYPSSSSYQSHRSKKHPEMSSREYLCKDCGKNFPSMQAFNKHIQKHIKVKNKHICDTCGKVLNSRYSLTMHTRIHTGEKPFKCKICGKSFIGPMGLKVHNITHTGERRHACEECGKRFTQRSSLVVHKRYHSGIKPFHCHICNKNFVTRTLLKNHQKTRHKEEALSHSSLQ